MPGPIETAFIEVRADTDRFRREARTAGQTAGTTGGRSFARSFGRAIIAAGAGAALGKFFTSSVSGASDLGESINAVNVIFGENADEIEALGATAADRLGLTQTEFNEAAVSISAFATTIAGEGGDVGGVVDDLSTRAGDFASVMNLPGGANEALQLFRSGLAGETEPLRRFGLDLSAASVEQFAYANGIAQTGEELTEAQKQQARYGLLMEQTSATAGDFANTQDSMANALRRIKANASEAATAFGKGLLPAVEGALGGVNDLLLGIEGPLEEVGAAVGEALTPLLDALGPSIETALSFLSPLLLDIGTIFGSLAPLVEPLVALLGEVVTIISGALAAGFEALAPVIEIVAEFIGDFADALGDTLGPIIEDLAPVLAELGEIFAEVLAEVLPIVMELFEALSPIIGEVAEIFGDVLLAVLPIIADAFTTILGALRPLIPVFKDALLRVLTALKPVLPILATALAQVAVSLAEILVALAPLIPPLLDLAVVLIEELGVPVLLAISDALVLISDAFADLAPIVTDLVEGPLTKAIEWITNWIKESPVAQAIIDGIVESFKDMGRLVGEAVELIKAVFSGDWALAWKQFKEFAVAALQVFVGLWDDLGPLILTALDTLWDAVIFPFLKDLPGLILEALASLGSLLLQGLSAGLNAVWQGIQDLWDSTLLPFIQSIPGLMLAGLGHALSALAGWGRDAGTGLWDAFTQRVVPLLESLIGKLPGWIGDALSALAGWARQLGTGLWDAFTGRLVPLLASLISKVPGWIGSAASAIGPWALDMGTRLWEAFTDRVVPLLGTFAAKVPGWIGSALFTIKDWARRLGTALWNEFTGRVVPLLGTLASKVPGWIGSALYTIKDWAIRLGTALWNEFTGRIVPLLKSMPGKIIIWIGDAIEDVVGLGVALAGKIAEGIKQFFTDNPVTNFIGGLFDGETLSFGESIWTAIEEGMIDAADPESMANGISAAIEQSYPNVDVSEAQAAEIGDAIVAGINSGAIDSGDDITSVIESVLGISLDDADTATPAGYFGESFGGNLIRSFDRKMKKDVDPFVAGLPQGMSKSLSKDDDAFETPGEQLIKGLSDAMDSAQVSVQVFLLGMSVRMVRWLGSLTKTFTAAGVQLMGGLAEGMHVGTIPITFRLISLRAQLVQWLGNLSTRFVSAGGQLMHGLNTGIFLGTPAVRQRLIDIRNALTVWVGDLSTRLVSAGGRLIHGLNTGIFLATPAVRQRLIDIRNALAPWVGNLSAHLVGAGLSLIRGLTAGVNIGLAGFIAFVRDIGTHARNAVGNLSKALYGQGQQLIQGLIDGMRSTIGRLRVSAIAALEFARGGMVPGTGAQMAVVHGGEMILNAAQQSALGGVLRWQSTALRALAYTNQSLSWVSDLLQQMRHESGGNPRAINLWDINATRGTPSKGLMQVIDPTFRAYARELFDRSVWDPFANIVAAIRYTVSRYGSLGAWRRRGFRGYEHGGMVPGRGPVPAIVHGGEMILNQGQQQALGGITLAPGAVVVNFTGALPTTAQAQRVGNEVGAGIADELERRRIQFLARSA